MRYREAQTAFHSTNLAMKHMNTLRNAKTPTNNIHKTTHTRGMQTSEKNAHLAFE